MTSAREIMSSHPETLTVEDTAAAAAQRLAASEIGAIPVCRADGHLFGMVTDRDLVVKVLAVGKDPERCQLGELADQAEVVTIGADDSVEEAVQAMTEHGVRRLPVIDGDQLVGIVSQGDIATHCSPDQAGRLVAAISAAP
jgi:CBS domain-containing protein